MEDPKAQPSALALEYAYQAGVDSAEAAIARLEAAIPWWDDETLLNALERLERQGTRQLGHKPVARCRAPERGSERQQAAAAKLASLLERAYRTVAGQEAARRFLTRRWEHAKGQRKKALRAELHALCQRHGMTPPWRSTRGRCTET